MKVLLAVFIALLWSNSVSAQDTTTMFLKAGTTIKDALFRPAAFYYPQFQKGRVFFMDGSTSSASMNYNTLSDEMHFVDPKGDTMAIANVQTIKLITLDKDSFFYDKGFIKLLSSNNNVKFGVKPSFRVVDIQKIGGYDMASSTSAITSYRTFYDGQTVYNLTVKEDMILKKVMIYYFGDKYNRFSAISRKSVLNLFSKQENKVKGYLKENDVDYSNKADLERLHQFLSLL